MPRLTLLLKRTARRFLLAFNRIDSLTKRVASQQTSLQEICLALLKRTNTLTQPETAKAIQENDTSASVVKQAVVSRNRRILNSVFTIIEYTFRHVLSNGAI